MSATAFNVVIIAAVLHATWNAIVKGSGDKTLATVQITISSALISAVLLPFFPTPDSLSWPFLAISVLLQTGYFLLVAATYRAADMSRAYPLMRGTAPLIVAISSVLFLDETLSPRAWWGIGLICAGILALALIPQAGGGRGTLLALVTAVVIACYTMVDGSGVRLSDSPAAYTLWLNLLTGIPFAVWLLAARPHALRGFPRQNWSLGLIGGFGTLTSYGLVLWAMAGAPIPLVSALRETSILFAAIISALVLREHVGPARILAVLLILAGAVVIRLF